MMLSTTITGETLAIGGAAALCAMAWAIFILAPAWTSYGRFWERIAASFLTLFILASLLGFGIAVGVAVIYIYTGSV